MVLTILVYRIAFCFFSIISTVYASGYQIPAPAPPPVITTTPHVVYHVQANWPTTTKKPECSMRQPTSCNRQLSEVCTPCNGTYVCDCQPGYSRLPEPDRRCLVTNECLDRRRHNCSPNAVCSDTLESYSCSCKDGFVDVSPDKGKPGRICKEMVDECSNPDLHKVDCHEHAKCQDTAQSYNCNCNTGFVDVSQRYNMPQGRQCEKEVDLCKSPSLNDCSCNATCSCSKNEFTCQCKPGHTDLSPDANYPGRVCKPPEVHRPQETCDPKKNTCSNGEQCTQLSYGHYVCQCPEGATRSSDNKCMSPEPIEPPPCKVTETCPPEPAPTTAAPPPPVSPPAPPPVRKFCEDYPECPAMNGTCINLKDFAYCQCNDTFVDLRQFPRDIKRKCHGDGICLKDADVDYCCLGVTNCHPSSFCLRLPAGRFTCLCLESKTAVPEKVPCPGSRPGILKDSVPELISRAKRWSPYSVYHSLQLDKLP